MTIVNLETAMAKFFGVSGAARELKDRSGEEVNPRDLTILFYLGKLDDGRCPVVSGRRLIPDDYLPVIQRVLRERRSTQA